MQCLKSLARGLDYLKLFFVSQPISTGMTLTDLPMCLQLNILERLADGRDIVNLGQVSPTLQVLSEDKLLWRKLCRYHFTERQVWKGRIAT